jgi:hypothetical protein
MCRRFRRLGRVRMLLRASEPRREGEQRRRADHEADGIAQPDASLGRLVQ